MDRTNGEVDAARKILNDHAKAEFLRRLEEEGGVRCAVTIYDSDNRRIVDAPAIVIKPGGLWEWERP